MIRRETRDDYGAISGVHALAFGGENESTLVERLRGAAPFIPELSLVAQLDGRVAGHVLFFPVAVADGLAACGGTVEYPDALNDG